MKFWYFVLLFSLSISTQQFVEAEEIICKYSEENFFNETVIRCSVENIQIFQGERINVQNASEINLNGKTNDDVREFYINAAPNINFFPKNISKIFKNIINIYIIDSKLSQITAEDLKEFPELKYFIAYVNSIENLPSDLFQNNSKLEGIVLKRNKISDFNSTVFRDLENLHILDLTENPCKVSKRANTRDEVLELLQEIDEEGCQAVDEQDHTKKETFEEQSDTKKEIPEEKLKTIENLINEFREKIESLENNLELLQNQEENNGTQNPLS